MPIYSVECIATVRKIYEVEAPDEMTARITAHMNEPTDEIEEFSIVSNVKEI